MKQHRMHLRALAVLALAGAPILSAHATDGYFPHGFGLKAKGMGGAAVGMSEDAFAGINNPAAAATAGNLLEAGIDVFKPSRGMERTGPAAPLNASVDSGSNTFLVPEFGYNQQVNDRIGVNVTVYGNGGMNTDYKGGQINCGMGPANVLCGNGQLGVDLMQLIVAPTVGYKINDMHSVGVSPLLVFQQFKAFGLQAFSPMSQDASALTNNGYAHSSGVGLRIGYLGKFGDNVTLGATYSPKISMGKFDKYKGLFAGSGSFDIPENYTIGGTFRVTPKALVALDYQRINYGGVSSISNPSTNMAPLGSPGGPGFGWKSINVWKLGVQWEAMSGLTLRAGINKSDNPVQARDVSFNIIAPGVITTHYTLGATYAVSPKMEVTFAYAHAKESKVTGASMFNSMMPAGAPPILETIRMHQNSFGVQVGWKF